MKKRINIVLCLILVFAMMAPMMVQAAGGSFQASANKATVKPGESFTVTMSGQSVGRVNISVSNGTSSDSKLWFDGNGGNTKSFTVTAGQSGVVTVTLSPHEGFSDLDAQLYEPGVRIVTVTIEEPVTEPETTEPEPTKPEPTEPKPTEPKPTEPKPTEPAEVPTENTTQAPTEAPTATPTEEATEALTEAPTTEPAPVPEEPGEGKNCLIHWLVLALAVILTIVIILLKKNLADYVAGAVYIIVALLSIFFGSCSLEWIMALIGLVIVAVGLIFSRKSR